MSDEIICVPVVHGADDALSGLAVRSFGALSTGTHNFQGWKYYPSTVVETKGLLEPAVFLKTNCMLSCIYELPGRQSLKIL
jgi:hypothetical protein